jgi:hypothetical protein
MIKKNKKNHLMNDPSLLRPIELGCPPGIQVLLIISVLICRFFEIAGIENLRLPDCTIDGLTFNSDLGGDD